MMICFLRHNLRSRTFHLGAMDSAHSRYNEPVSENVRKKNNGIALSDGQTIWISCKITNQYVCSAEHLGKYKPTYSVLISFGTFDRLWVETFERLWTGHITQHIFIRFRPACVCPFRLIQKNTCQCSFNWRKQIKMKWK